MTHLLDTDTCIDLLRGKAGPVAQAATCCPGDLAVSAVTRYELLYGVERCSPQWRRKEGEKVRYLLEHLQVLPFTADTAGHAARVRASLEAAGKPIGPMDVLIAATAIEHSLPVVTGNLAEFRRVPGLRCVSWGG